MAYNGELKQKTKWKGKDLELANKLRLNPRN
jgi:hypothetical protein